MEEALEILWTYARREPLDSNGETIVPTINNSIAAIRIIMRLEGWAMGSEKRKIKPSENLELGHRREERKVMKEERRVINVADYTSFEEEEEEDVSPFAPFLLDEDDWSCSADNQLPKETPLSTIHYSLSTQKLPSLVPVAETPYHQQLKSCAKKYFSKYMITQPFSNGKCQPTTSCKRPYIAIDHPYDGFPTKKRHPTLHYFSIGITQAELLSNVRPPPKSLKLVEQINSRKTTV